MMQGVQVLVQNRVLSPVLFGGDRTVTAPWVLNLFNWLPFLRRFPARVVGMGFRPEHVLTSKAA